MCNFKGTPKESEDPLKVDICDALDLDLNAELFHLEELALPDLVEPDPANKNQLQPATEWAGPIFYSYHCSSLTQYVAGLYCGATLQSAWLDVPNTT